MGEDRKQKSWNIPQKNSRKQAKNGSLRILCVFYGYFTVILWFLHPVQHLELSAYDGTKKVRETSDMVRVLPTENTKDTKIKMHMKSENIEPQNTQKCAEIYNGSSEGQEKVFVSFRVVCG